MNHLEKLVSQFYQWRGYLVRNNVKVGALPRGGWEGELDVVAYHPQVGHLIQIEPSLDAHPWTQREARFRKKFELGRRYICQDVFPWLAPTTPIEQVAILATASRRQLGGGKVVSVDEFIATVKDAISKRGPLRKHAIPEEFDLLRTLQLALCGYGKLVD
jgi:hypothetical protein